MMTTCRTACLGMCGAALLVLLLALPHAAMGCDISQFELAEQEELPRYTFVLIFESGTKEGDAALAVVKKLSEKWAKRANIDFESVDIKTERGARIAMHWQVKTVPAAFIISPTGWSLAAFEGALEEAKIEATLTSPGKAALKDALAAKKAAYLVLGAAKMQGYEDALKAAREAAKSVKETMQIDVGTVIVDPTDPREVKLLQNLGLEEPPKEAAVYVAFGKCRAVLQEVEAENLKERLAFTIQLLATADQCSLGQEIRGEPLLLGK